MSGLREKQKAMRRQAISEAAVRLFEKQGYQDTTVEQIAREANVSAPTVFTYFGSKQEILLEMLREGDRIALGNARAQMSKFDNPVEALCYLNKQIVDYTFATLRPSLWREILPMVLIGGGDNGLPEAYKNVNDALMAEVSALLQELKDEGKIRTDLDVDLAAFLFNDYSHLQLLRLTSQEPMDLDAYAQQVRRITTLIFQGMRP
ncbi:TetR family transcriptional regulator [Pseudomonas frederiksbergensis]|uniref:TetR family transcriptional regulator n=1 Tax=Pseudomonas frederiksbergensis TaxID=104087 RepID=A0A1J0ER46_9PSED|nr:TetR/AcrR family transcriptional regulator [Pseudomonas frederiksbergensis]APC18626.1 TetR family transcriptional regulator [Pseudomonas frederiksbergensis]